MPGGTAAQSLERLQIDAFDLYQLHAVTSIAELDECTAAGGALEAAIQARDEGLTRYIGITGHGNHSPAVFIEALRRFDFDSILFPINPVQYANPEYRGYAEDLIEICAEQDVGTMIIKAVTKQPWGDREQWYATWYEPYDDAENIQRGVDFALSQNVTGLCTAGDINVLPKFLEACVRFTPMDASDQEAVIQANAQYDSIFSD